jgi:hypothetical protein
VHGHHCDKQLPISELDSQDSARSSQNLHVAGEKQATPDVLLVWGKLGLLGNDGAINVSQHVSTFLHEFAGFLDEYVGARAFPLRIIVREYLPYVRQRQSTCGQVEGMKPYLVSGVMSLHNLFHIANVNVGKAMTEENTKNSICNTMQEHVSVRVSLAALRVRNVLSTNYQRIAFSKPV